MSHMIMDMVQSVELSLDTRNWIAAITTSLTLPDICAKVDGSFGGGSCKRYSSWFDEYVAKLPQDTGIPIDHYGYFFGGKDCYALRCAYLHEGDTDIDGQSAREYLSAIPFEVSKQSPWSLSMAYDGETEKMIFTLDPGYFCHEISRAVHVWLDAKESDAGVQARLQILPRISFT